MVSVIGAIAVFAVLVLAHELGHFVTAKMTGMRVDEFAIGFGPKLFSVQRGETTYSLRILPLGGFNDIAGMERENNKAGKRGYCEKSIPARMLVILAGSMMNLLLPIIIFFSIFFFHGISTPGTEPVLGKVFEDKAAFSAGLREGDRIISVAGEKVDTWADFVSKVKTQGGKELIVVYERGGSELSTALVPQYDAKAGRAMVGVMGTVHTQDVGFIDSVTMSVRETGRILGAMLHELGRIFSRFSGEDLAGPIGVVSMTGEMAELGLVPLLNFAAFLSMNLGIINLLPIPALDGGHFLMLIFEAIIRRPLPSKFLYYTQGAGIAILIMLTLFATKNDISRMLGGG